MAALMGPSGSGKTTLLDILAGRKTQGKIEGALQFGGEKPTPAFLKRYTGGIPKHQHVGDHAGLTCTQITLLVLFTCYVHVRSCAYSAMHAVSTHHADFLPGITLTDAFPLAATALPISMLSYAAVADRWPAVAGYVEQFDTLIPSLTVSEMLLYTAELKRPRQESLDSKKAAVEHVLNKLSLNTCRSVGRHSHTGCTPA